LWHCLHNILLLLLLLLLLRQLGCSLQAKVLVRLPSSCQDRAAALRQSSPLLLCGCRLESKLRVLCRAYPSLVLLLCLQVWLRVDRLVVLFWHQS
jgi:hypothetical protein